MLDTDRLSIEDEREVNHFDAGDTTFEANCSISDDDIIVMYCKPDGTGQLFD